MLSIVFIIGFGLLPFIIIRFLNSNYDLLSKPAFRLRFGTLYDGIRINPERKVGSIFMLSFFYFRRLILAAAVVFIQKQLLLQIGAFLFTNLVKLAMLSSLKPYESRKLLRSELTNEIVSLFIVYHMVCFTDWIPDI